MYHPHLTTYVNEYLDLTLRDLEHINVAFPVYVQNKAHLYICDVEIGHRLNEGFRDITRQLLENFTANLERKGGKTAKKLFGRKWDGVVGNGGISSDLAKPTQRSVDTSIQSSLEQMRDHRHRLDSTAKIHLGALYSSLINQGYVIHNGRCARFQTSYLPHFPHLRICNVVTTHPYGNVAVPA